MKKVLFYNGSLRMGGIERVLVEVLQNIDRSKMSIDLMIEDGIKGLNVFEKDIPKDIKIYYLKSEELIQKTDFYRKNKKNIFYKIMYNIMMNYEGYIKRKNLKKMIKGKSYDVVIDFDMGLSKHIDLIKAEKKIAWIHASIKNWYEKESKIRRLEKRLEKYGKVVTICDEMKNETGKLLPNIKNKLVRIYNPFNFDRIKNLADDYENINMSLYNQAYIISIARLTLRQKDFFTLIKGFKLVKKYGFKEKLYILGDGPDKEKIQKMISEEKMENEIFLLGNVKNPYPWIKNSKMLVHSSKYEGLPTVLIESLILDKIVISSRCPTGPSEILENGEIGFLYEIGDYRKLSELITENLKNNISNEKINQKIQKYSVEKIIKEYEQIILS